MLVLVPAVASILHKNVLEYVISRLKKLKSVPGGGPPDPTLFSTLNETTVMSALLSENADYTYDDLERNENTTSLSDGRRYYNTQHNVN